jgi:RNA polymerase sigma-70 factor, ECF subfamily
MGDEADREFFRAEVERLSGRLYGAALRLARNSADAEDLVAETTLKAWKSFDQLEDRQAFHAWILRILSNTFISMRRRVEPECCGETDIEIDGETFSLFDRLHQPFLLWWANPEQDLIAKLLREDIAAAIDGLPVSYRAVLVMVEVNGMSYAEVAQTLGVPVGTVRSRLARGRSLMQRALWQHAVEAGLCPGKVRYG